MTLQELPLPDPRNFHAVVSNLSSGSKCGLSPREQLERQVKLHSFTQDEALLSWPNSSGTLRSESEMERTKPPCDIQTPRRADHEGFQRKDSRSYVGQEPEQHPGQGAGEQCRQETQGRLFLPCSSHLSRQKRGTQAEEDQPKGSLWGIPVPGSDKHREMSCFVTVEPRKTTSCSRR